MVWIRCSKAFLYLILVFCFVVVDYFFFFLDDDDLHVVTLS